MGSTKRMPRASKLQRLGVVVRGLVQEFRIERVVDDSQPERSHVHPNWCVFPVWGSSRYSARCSAGVERFSLLDAGFGVRFAVDDFGEQVAAGLCHAVAHDGREFDGGIACGGRRSGHAFVFLLDLALFEKHLVLAAGLRIGGEQQQPGGHAVQAVHGDEVRKVQQIPEPDQCGFLDVGAARGGGQEVWLVHHKEVLVLVEDVDFHRKPGFRRERAVVPDEGVVLRVGCAVSGARRPRPRSRRRRNGPRCPGGRCGPSDASCSPWL